METAKQRLPHNYSPRNYQLPAWEYFQGNEEGKRGVCVWHRRAGKDLFAINLIATKLFQRVGVYWHLLPTYKQGRAIVWNGFTREGRRFLDYLPQRIRTRSYENEMRIHFKSPYPDGEEGSVYQVVGTDDVNSLVGTNPIGCVFSEYSLHDPAAWDYIRPILAENGGWALFIFTPRGKNHGYKLLQDAHTAGWFVDVRKAGGSDDATKRPDGTPVISDEIIQNERIAGMPEEMIQQEFFVSFEAPLVGAYYSQQMAKADKENRICNVPYDPKLPVDTSWDIGFNDATSIVFSQTYGLEERIIDYYESSGEGLAHYVRILREKEYVYGKHYAPHDIEVAEFSSGKTRLETARGLGIRFVVTQKHDVEDGIEQVRNILPRCWFDRIKCARLLEALKSYRKEWDDNRKMFKSHPFHDWSSNAADAFRYKCWNTRQRSKYGQQQPQTVAEDNYAYV